MELRYGFISVDDHVQEHPEVWTSRMSRAQWGDRIPHVERDADGTEHWMVDGRRLPLAGVASAGAAVAANVLLLGLFAVQHTIMARPAFKEVWTRWVPWHVERSTFVLLSTAILAVMAWQWRPLPEPVWRFESLLATGALTAASLAGWGMVLVSTFLIDHFELFGVKQTVSYALGRPLEHPRFRERLFYRWVRHPLMLGFLIAFWATPTMSQGHLLFAVVTTLYVVIAIQIEERTLVHLHGEEYRSYQRRVPMLLPFGRRQQD